MDNMRMRDESRVLALPGSITKAVPWFSTRPAVPPLESTLVTTDWLIVGAGLTGCTFAERIAAELGQRVILIDSRNHVGGNAYDYYNSDGILVHKYGPHIFHTNSQRVWDYLSRFTSWRPYFHQVLGVVEGHKVPVPFNLNSIAELFPKGLASRLEDALLRSFPYGAKVPILKMLQSEDGIGADKDLRFLADFVYKNVFLGYTIKQWGLKPEELDPSVTARVPIHVSRDNRYFQDTYQSMPADGFSAMFERMLAHRNIRIMLQTDFRSIEREISHKRLIFTGPMDEYFDTLHGGLPYRSLKLDFETVGTERYQETGTVNFPNEHALTRCTEFKYLTGQTHAKTTIAREYPCPYVPGETVPYYPVPRAENAGLYGKYLDEAKKLKGKVVFAGRLADYKYYNMDQAVAHALKVFEQQVANQ